MNDYTIFALVIAALVGGIIALVFFRRKKEADKIEESAVLKVYSDVQTRADSQAPASPLVCSDRQESAEMLAAIHTAVIEKIEDARALGFDAGLNPSDYIVYVITPDREYDSDGVYVPNFKIRNALNYDGTQWDLDPRPGHAEVWAAEFVIMDGNNPSNEWVVARYTREWATAQAAVGNGLDHILQFKNQHVPGHEGDYLRDLTHTVGGHPLIPPRQVRGFANLGVSSKTPCQCAMINSRVEGRRGDK